MADDMHDRVRIHEVTVLANDWHVLRKCPCPLMLVNRLAQALPSRIIAAVEPGMAEHREGHLNQRIIAAAKDIAGLAGTTVELAYAFDGLSPASSSRQPSHFSSLAEAYDTVRQKHVDRFMRLAEHHEVPSNRCHVLYGEPWPMLSNLAHDPLHDLLVLGTIQRSSLDRLLIGSTAERILDEARCDILAIKPERPRATRVRRT